MIWVKLNCNYVIQMCESKWEPFGDPWSEQSLAQKFKKQKKDAAHWGNHIVTHQAKVIEESSQYEFENYMRQQLLLAEEKNTIHEAKSFLTKRQFGSIPPVRRLGHDAQPVSPLDAAILAQRFLRK